MQDDVLFLLNASRVSEFPNIFKTNTGFVVSLADGGEIQPFLDAVL